MFTMQLQYDYSTKIVLKNKQMLHFEHIKRKDEKNINKLQINVRKVMLL